MLGVGIEQGQKCRENCDVDNPFEPACVAQCFSESEYQIERDVENEYGLKKTQGDFCLGIGPGRCVEAEVKGQQYKRAERGDAGRYIGCIGYARYGRTESEGKQIVAGCGGMSETLQLMSYYMSFAGRHSVMLERDVISLTNIAGVLCLSGPIISLLCLFRL